MSDETATTDWGYWSNVSNYRQPIDEVNAFLGDQAEGFDVDAIMADYREQIGAALPDRVSLAGDQFIGPHPAPADYREQISAALDTVDLAAIVARHER